MDTVSIGRCIQTHLWNSDVGGHVGLLWGVLVKVALENPLKGFYHHNLSPIHRIGDTGLIAGGPIARTPTNPGGSISEGRTSPH